MTQLHHDGGFSLLETMFASLICIVVIITLGGVIVQAMLVNKNQGQETTRATVYAQDKIEALLALSFTSCTQSSSSQPASCNTTGVSDSGWRQGLLTGGAITPIQPACPASGASVGYVDYLDISGIQMQGSSCANLASTSGSSLPSYVRQWAVADLPTTGAAMKQITVAVYSLKQVNANWSRPLVVVTSVISN